ncbi:transcription factor UPBEAT1-like [Durio zibethinus]|uniref:Transcription factor UPBEAT1-like n=1 Tax=Durio zibethinus TaxID=66656 RepID=A0A6P6BER9_DURZI|nr:transcription factor UPBEAT1-like [Durio zibethinus]
MGISPLPLPSFDSNGIQGNEEMSESNGSLWSKLLEAPPKRRLKAKKQRSVARKKVRRVRCRRPRSIVMKRRPHSEGSRRPMNHIEQKVKTLKKLIPNNDSMGLDGLFRETAEYILSLQMRVKVMQIMVKVLTGSDE